MELEGYGWPTCSKQSRRVDRRMYRQQGRPSTSFVDNTIDLPAKFFKFGVWDQCRINANRGPW